MYIDEGRSARAHILQNPGSLLSNVIADISPLIRLPWLGLLASLGLNSDLALRVLRRALVCIL